MPGNLRQQKVPSLFLLHLFHPAPLDLVANWTTRMRPYPREGGRYELEAAITGQPWNVYLYALTWMRHKFLCCSSHCYYGRVQNSQLEPNLIILGKKGHEHWPFRKSNRSSLYKVRASQGCSSDDSGAPPWSLLFPQCPPRAFSIRCCHLGFAAPKSSLSPAFAGDVCSSAATLTNSDSAWPSGSPNPSLFWWASMTQFWP